MHKLKFLLLTPMSLLLAYDLMQGAPVMADSTIKIKKNEKQIEEIKNNNNTNSDDIKLDTPPTKGVKALDPQSPIVGAFFPIESLLNKTYQDVRFLGTRNTRDERNADGAFCTELLFENKSKEERIIQITYMERVLEPKSDYPHRELKKINKKMVVSNEIQALPLCLARTTKQKTTITGEIGIQILREVKFKGKISKIHFGIAYDGTNHMVIDSKHVIFAEGGMLPYHVEPDPIGKLHGFKFPTQPVYDLNEYIGDTAEVFAIATPISAGNNKFTFIYSIIGSADYYIKLK